MTEHGHDDVLAGVIELGSTSVRMAVAQRRGRRGFHLLNQLVLPVGLGRDAFTEESLSPATIERCVDATRTFRTVLEREFGLSADRIRVVATSAVREARNREQFIDRMLIGTGFRVEVLDEAEVGRLTYLAVRPQLRVQPFFRRTGTLVAEVGGGSTDILLFRRGRVTTSHVYRLGSLRMLRELGDMHSSSAHGTLVMLGDYAAQTLEQIREATGAMSTPRLVALGGEPRLLCRDEGDTGDEALRALDLSVIERVTRRLLTMPVEDVARHYGITLQEAETLAPALFLYGAIARELGVREILVSNASLRHGLLTEQLHGSAWDDEFRRQTISSGLALARHYRVDLKHARHVARHAGELLRFMQTHAPITARDAIILNVAALLHEIGMFVSARAYHKHSFYLIQNSDIFGLGTGDTTLAAHVARYHRRTSPRPTHEEYLALSSEERIRVAMLAAILRVADCLDFEHGTSPSRVSFETREDELVVTSHTDADIELAQRQLEWMGEMFRNVFGLRVRLRAAQ